VVVNGNDDVEYTSGGHLPNFLSTMPTHAQSMQPIQPSAPPQAVTMRAGTSRSNVYMCPLCKKEKYVLARDRRDGFYYLQKHECLDGIVRERVRVA